MIKIIKHTVKAGHFFYTKPNYIKHWLS